MASDLLARFGREELARLALAEKCRRSLAAFTLAAWHIIEPGTPLRWNWHIDAVCRALEAVSRGAIRKLIINIPPGTMKSILVSVMWPAWEWTWNPGERSLFGSYAMELAMRDSVRCRSIVDSDWYRQLFVPDWKLSGDQNVKSFFENTARGFRMSLSVGGAGTGFRGRKVVVDDPLNAKDAHSEPARRESFEWWTKTMPTRVNDPATGAFVIVMQRLHEDDLTGHMLREGGYVHLCLPSIYEASIACPCGQKPCVAGPLGKVDPRTEDGELLFASMFTPAVLAELKRTLGSAGFAGQHQQRPMPSDGGMFKNTWWRFWRHEWEDEIPELAARTVVLPKKFDRKALSWDCTFVKSSGSDLVAGAAWGAVGAERYLLELEWDRMDFNETERRLVEQYERHPDIREAFVELAANGPAIINRLKDKVRGLIGVRPAEYGSKTARAAAGAPQVEAGQVFLPLHAKWRDAYISEHAAFPNGGHDDAVDQQSQLLLKWADPAGAARLRRAMLTA